jgi:hypothetical protein
MFVMVVVSLSATRCLQAPSSTDDNGPVVAASDVQTAILNGWGHADFASALKDEYLYIEQDQKISTLEPRVVYKESTQITNRVIDPEDAKYLKYTMLIRSTSLENGTFKPITSSEDEFSVLNTDPPMTAPETAENAAKFPDSMEALQKSMQNGTVGLLSGEPRNHFLGIMAVQNMLLSCVKGPNWDVTCHNLQISEGVRSAPTGVASRPDCGGIPDCKIRYKEVSFELVVNLPATAEQEARSEKVVYDMVFSPDVPYLSRLLDFCYQGMIPTANQKVLIKICNRVQNFEHGQ